MSNACLLYFRYLFSYFYSLFIVHFLFFFFNDTATTEIYTLSLHDALPILARITGSSTVRTSWPSLITNSQLPTFETINPDRKSTRLNSSHLVISYAVFCLKKKKQYRTHVITNNHYENDLVDNPGRRSHPRC